MSTSTEPFDLVPPAEMLFDGTQKCEEFVETGDNFVRAYLIDRGRLLPHERILDIGSGNGQKARPLTRFLAANGSYVGIDVVASGINWCRENYRARFPNFSFDLIDVKSSHYNPDGKVSDDKVRLPYPDGNFDMVLLSSVFTHMEPAGAANYIAEIARVLKPGGRCVATFSFVNKESILRALQGLLPATTLPHRYATHWIADKESPTTWVALSENFVRDEFANANLRICEVTYGSWTGAPDMFGAAQDVIIAKRL